MTCAEFEVLITDYIDGTLPASERAAVESHLAGCAGCRALAEDIGSAVRILAQAKPVEPPADLITRISFLAPAGRVRAPHEEQGWWSRWASQWIQPILQPRLVMSMAMTILSFAMLERCTGVKVQHVQTADLNPVRIWDGVENKTLRLRDRAVKYYENLRWVYEIEVELRTLQDQQAAAGTQQQTAAGTQDARPQPAKQPGKTENGGTK